MFVSLLRLTNSLISKNKYHKLSGKIAIFKPFQRSGRLHVCSFQKPGSHIHMTVIKFFNLTCMDAGKYNQL